MDEINPRPPTRINIKETNRASVLPQTCIDLPPSTQTFSRASNRKLIPPRMKTIETNQSPQGGLYRVLSFSTLTIGSFCLFKPRFKISKSLHLEPIRYPRAR